MTDEQTAPDVEAAPSGQRPSSYVLARKNPTARNSNTPISALHIVAIYIRRLVGGSVEWHQRLAMVMVVVVRASRFSSPLIPLFRITAARRPSCRISTYMAPPCDIYLMVF